MLKPDIPHGIVKTVWLESEVLKGNPWDDPNRRRIDVYLPPGFDENSHERLPVVFDLVGFTSGGPAHTAYRAFGESLPEQMDRLIATGQTKPAVLVFPDCFTKLGGNQYINSPGVGRWADFIHHEVIPFIESVSPILPGRDHRGVFGKSSGGYGAINYALRYSEYWNAVACHSGDMYFEFGYFTDFPKTLNVLAQHGYSIPRFLDYFHQADKLGGDDFHCLMTLAMAATYDPDTENPQNIRLPIDLKTGALDPARWAVWLKHDPVRLVDKYHENLKALSLLFIDCGDRDQYHLVYGARQFHNKLEHYRIDHIYEEFPDNHSSVNYRFDRSLPLIIDALTT
ncbi:MAG: enterochelin esterase [Lentisphaeria bacterium]|nr:enterochelin esterase [Candidatus Neomarinimicrobiota bacterium]MCF7842367.1 enterochelin esterase [Lentisphaeria bacterium]